MVSARVEAMEKIFNPRSVAFVGASNAPMKWGGIVFRNLVQGNFEGKIYPVNPRESEVVGIPAYRSVTDIPGEVDLAIFTIPAAAMPDAISECVRKGIKAGVVITAGFAETGEDGRALQDDLVARAAAGGMVLIGPNGQGIAVPRSKLYPWLPPFKPDPGAIGIVSQSGSFATTFSTQLAELGFGCSLAISAGNCADLAWPDYLEYLRQDEDTKVALLYVEGFRDGNKFFQAAKALAREKPVVMLKTGRTSSGAGAVASHTGVLAGADQVFDAACHQAGVTRVYTLDQAVFTAAGFVSAPLPQGRRLAILTGGGGYGVLAADAAEGLGLEVRAPSPALIKKLQEQLPPWWSPGNPIDMVAGMGWPGPKEIIPILMESTEFDGVVLVDVGYIYPMIDAVNRPPDSSEAETLLREAMLENEVAKCMLMLEYTRKWGKPLLITSAVVRLARRRQYRGILEFLDAGVMLYPAMEDVTNMFAALAQRHEFLKREGLA